MFEDDDALADLCNLRHPQCLAMAESGHCTCPNPPSLHAKQDGAMERLIARGVCARAIVLFGRDHQLRQLTEECAELIVAVNHLARLRIEAADVAEEIADVEVMLEQARLIVGDGLVDAAKARKLRRLETKINQL